MTVQVLVATMNQKNHELLDKMNIQSDVIVGNQCSFNRIEEFDYKGHKAVFLNFAEKGVGLNRNNVLMRATGDICLFADDDMQYVDGYPSMISKAFESNLKADVIVFNITGRKQIHKRIRISRFNYLRYGTARIAIRLSSIRKRGIFFNQCFGGGTEHCHGEDNLFLTECLNKGLKIYSDPILLAKLLDDRPSSWDTHNLEQYIVDQGFLFKTISPVFWRFLCFLDIVRRRNFYGNRILITYRKMTRLSEKVK